ncbi:MULTISPECIES: hypothetical protein [Kitasatospora]|uniref:hypothetical protein n=1 Tax=Kitasatospora TaxID=2063 RepID=UPI000CC83CFE|nr:hypothetical protein [Kitasatospora sp. GP30]MDH6138047.1 hypothetical protein [Kitasatospora sp. GP30]
MRRPRFAVRVFVLGATVGAGLAVSALALSAQSAGAATASPNDYIWGKSSTGAVLQAVPASHQSGPAGVALAVPADYQWNARPAAAAGTAAVKPLDYQWN